MPTTALKRKLTQIELNERLLLDGEKAALNGGFWVESAPSISVRSDSSRAFADADHRSVRGLRR